MQKYCIVKTTFESEGQSQPTINMDWLVDETK